MSNDLGRVEYGDLLLAAEWLESYETTDAEGKDQRACFRVAKMQRADAARREARMKKESLVRAVAEQVGKPTAEVRKVLRRRGEI